MRGQTTKCWEDKLSRDQRTNYQEMSRQTTKIWVDRLTGDERTNYRHEVLHSPRDSGEETMHFVYFTYNSSFQFSTSHMHFKEMVYTLSSDGTVWPVYSDWLAKCQLIGSCSINNWLVDILCLTYILCLTAYGILFPNLCYKLLRVPHLDVSSRII